MGKFGSVIEHNIQHPQNKITIFPATVLTVLVFLGFHVNFIDQILLFFWTTALFSNILVIVLEINI